MKELDLEQLSKYFFLAEFEYHNHNDGLHGTTFKLIVAKDEAEARIKIDDKVSTKDPQLDLCSLQKAIY